MSLTPDSTSEKHRIEHKELASREATQLDNETRDVDPQFARRVVYVAPNVFSDDSECTVKRQD